jgi:hypothetical protein
MKKTIILSLTLIIAVSAFATVRTVSSNPSTLGQFSTIQAAIDASADSDTVHVYGSPNTYAGFTILDKKITVIGPGWAPDKNLPLQAIVGGAVVRNSPAGGSPDGSELQGLVFITPVYLSQNAVGGDQGVNNLRIIRCQFNSSLNWDLATSGHLIEGSLFYNVLNFSSSLTYQNFLFQNNMFFLNVFSPNYVISGLTNSVNVRFDHNLFYSTNNSGGSTAPVFNGSNRFLTFSNNIFNQTNVGINVSLSTFSNNITNNITLNSTNAISNATPWAVNSNVDGGGNAANASPGMVDQTIINGKQWFTTFKLHYRQWPR